MLINDVRMTYFVEMRDPPEPPEESSTDEEKKYLVALARSWSSLNNVVECQEMRDEDIVDLFERGYLKVRVVRMEDIH